MAATKQAGRPARPASLPPISVARLKEATLLVERLVASNTDVFIQAGQNYRARHRTGSSRPLDAEEVAAIARGLGTTLADAQQQIDDAQLVHRDEPEAQEVLLAAGVATAPQFMDAALRMVALLEMPNEAFEQARESGDAALDAAIDTAIVDLEKLGLTAARPRAAAAFQHLADESGTDPGKAFGLVARSVWQGLEQAMSHLLPATGRSESSTTSPASTAGRADRSSTTPAGTTPGS